jgi:CRP-like cAMP-binding protein
MSTLHDDLGTCMIGEHSAFRFLCGENMDHISGFFQRSSVKKGVVLWKEGDPSEYVAVICSGEVEILKQTEFEGKHAVVGVYKTGAVIGALGILDGHNRAVTARAREDMTLITITKDNFETIIEKHPELATKLLKGMLLSVSMRLRKSFERMSTFF